MTLPETPKPALPAGKQNTVKGMALVMVTALAGASANVIIRFLSHTMHPLEIAFFRSFFGLVVFAPVFMRHGLAPLKTKRPYLLCFRGILQVVQMILVVTAIKLTPLAKVAALRFTGPLFATVFTLMFLGEKVHARRITALIVGFSGVLVILRPGMVDTDLGAVLALSATVVWATVQMTVKVLGRTESSVTITIFSTMIATPISFLLAIPVLTMPTWQELFWVFCLGGLGSLAHLCRAQAYKEADLTAVTPMEFSKLIWVSILAFFLFGEVPEIWTWFGGIMIFSGSAYIAIRERKLKKDADKKEPPMPVAPEQ
ncbi:MAG: DMT family transporter [Rhodospirillales bacterium]|jgi:drug/metabolite transporter (DMT)-like permease